MLQKEEAAIASVQKALKVLDGYLLEHTFLVGESVTLADIIAACNLYLGFTKVRCADLVSSCVHQPATLNTDLDHCLSFNTTQFSCTYHIYCASQALRCPRVLIRGNC